MNKKIFFVTNGSSDQGFGHITRCLSLYQAFVEQKITPHFIVQGNQSVEKFLHIPVTLFDWTTDLPGLLRQVSSASAVIIDSYLAPPDIYDSVASSTFLVNIDDNHRLDHYPPGVVLNPALGVEDTYNYGHQVETLLGVAYFPMRTEFWSAFTRLHNPQISSLLVTLGGADITNQTPDILRILQSRFPQIKKTVVVGNAFTNRQAIKQITDSSQTTLVTGPDAAGMRDLMIHADVCVSAAGQTLYELAHMGLPTLALAIAKNQKDNVVGWQTVGFINYLGYYSDINLDYVLPAALLSVSQLSVRQAMGDAGQKTIDGQGSRRVVKEILSRC